jgi:hypothetical protein
MRQRKNIARPLQVVLALCVCAVAARVAPELTLGSSGASAVDGSTDVTSTSYRAGLESGCEEVVVGAGWAGVYYGYRRAKANPLTASKVQPQP